MTLPALITILASCAGAALIGWLTGVVVRLVARRRPFLETADRRCRWPWTATLVTAAALSSTPAAEMHGHLESGVRHALLILMIASVTWLCVRIVRTVEDAAFGRLRMDVENNRRVRKLRTQISVLSRIVVVALVIIGVAVALMTFAKMRTFGASLLASAGVAGIVGGLAAQSTLGNVFAGLQIAFTDALRIDDVVVAEGEWGRVEELTLTYVVLHLWDERRLVLPSTYFTTQPFQNWTRTSARVLGAVELYLDYRTPLDELRAVAEQIVHDSPKWDGQVFAVQVTDATERAMVVRVLASAPDAGRAFDLRCTVREQLLKWAVEKHPQALPAARVLTDTEAVEHELARLSAN
jgi:small-conductance mechanosensitive channel